MRIPKSLIQENLHTSNFDALYTRGGVRYVGNIFKLVTGEYYTGKTYTGNSQQLFFLENNALVKTEKNKNLTNSNNNLTRYITDNSNNTEYRLSYKKSRNASQNIFTNNRILIPEENVKNPDTFSYISGSTLRFICKCKYNDSYYFTNIKSYKNFKKYQNSHDLKYLSMFLISGIPWYIRANSREDVIKINQFYINRLKTKQRYKDFNDIDRFLTQYDEFYRDKNEQLYTSGNELVYDNEKNYVGLYHIHPEKGPMVGPTHTAKPHKQLYLRNTKVSLEEGISKLASVYVLDKVLKKLNINNISKGITLNDNQIKNLYKEQKQTQNESLRSTTQVYDMSNNNVNNITGRNYSSGGGGY